jgi:hypothetical protein
MHKPGRALHQVPGEQRENLTNDGIPVVTCNEGEAPKGTAQALEGLCRVFLRRAVRDWWKHFVGRVQDGGRRVVSWPI